MKSVKMVLLSVGMVALLWGSQALACCGKCSASAGKKGKTLKPQTTCPVMGGKIDKKHYVDIKCFRIYVCCKGCAAKVKADPQKYLKKLTDNGQRPEIRLALCSKCGQVKGSPKCCAKGAKKCPKCNLAKGSPDCCRHLKPAKGEKDVLFCPQCGEVKGSEKCCVKDAKQCPKCGLNKGAPLCCKVGKACGGPCPILKQCSPKKGG